MPPAIYDRPTRELLKEMLQELCVGPEVTFNTNDVVEWFAARYPKLRENSIKAYLVQACTNDGSRLHRPNTSEKDDLLFKVGRGVYRRYKPELDPKPIH